MQQLVYVEPGRVEWQDAPDPSAAVEGAVVRPLAVARCDLDLPMVAFGLFPGPFPVGHETVAEVVEVGEQVRRVRPGDRVVVPFQVSCGTCPPCARGRFAACEPYRARAGAAFGFGESGGGHGGAVADLLAVPAADHLLVDAPAAIESSVLCTLADNVVDGWRTVGPGLRTEPAADVLVVGGLAASVGLYAVAAAVAEGAGAVRYADTDASRCATAERLGADVTHVADAWPKGFPPARLTVDNTGTAEGLACALRSTDGYGTCTSVGIQFTPRTEVPLLAAYTRGVTLHISRADSRRYLPDVLPLVAGGRLDPSAIPTTTVGWDDAATAWLEPATKLVITR